MASLFNPSRLVALGVPKVKLWPKWQIHDPQNQDAIDHQAWDTWLQTYLDAHDPSGIYRVRYGAVTPAHRQDLAQYLEPLQKLPISQYNRQEQRAYWINLYNALTVKLVIDHYPLKSIKDVSSGFLKFGPWDDKLAQVEGENLTLNDIEHRILRPIWSDNRIHYALNCASLGCPNLQTIAYTATNTETLLESAARSFINHPRGVAFEEERLRVSSIYVWYKEDFGGSHAKLLLHLQHLLQL